MIRRLLRLSRAGQPYEGVVLRCNEAPSRVPFQGYYGVDKKGELDPKCPVEGNHTDGWKRMR